MYAYRCVTSYQGTRYNGWQKQGNTDRTIQGKLETVLSELLGEPVEIMGSGRTDAGVHALGQVFHFHCKKQLDLKRDSDTAEILKDEYKLFVSEEDMALWEQHISEKKVYRHTMSDLWEQHMSENRTDRRTQPEMEEWKAAFLKKLNDHLPLDIRVLSIEECDLRFSARLHATKKVYRYRIDCSPFGNPFLRDTAYHLNAPLNLGAMREASSLLLGTHDFKSFCDNKRMKKSTVRRIDEILLEQRQKEEELFLTFSGNGFLYHMVRILTGTLIEVGLGNIQPVDMGQILDGMDRQLAGPLAPAKGLCLMSVEYGSDSNT